MLQRREKGAKAERIAALVTSGFGAVPPGEGVEMRPRYLRRDEALHEHRSDERRAEDGRDRGEGARDADDRRTGGDGDLCFGTVDTWLVYKMTGGQAHVTDVSNASRTLLMDVTLLKWDEGMRTLFGVPEACLPEIRGSAESYGTTRSARLSRILQDDHGMYLNGVILISSILDFQTARFNVGNDLPYPLFLPTYTATAWYHKRLPQDLQAGGLQTSPVSERGREAIAYVAQAKSPAPVAPASFRKETRMSVVAVGGGDGSLRLCQ